MDRNLCTGWCDGRYAGDFVRSFVLYETHTTTDGPAKTNRSDHRCVGDTITEPTDGEDAINLLALTDITGFKD